MSLVSAQLDDKIDVAKNGQCRPETADNQRPVARLSPAEWKLELTFPSAQRKLFRETHAPPKRQTSGVLVRDGGTFTSNKVKVLDLEAVVRGLLLLENGGLPVQVTSRLKRNGNAPAFGGGRNHLHLEPFSAGRYGDALRPLFGHALIATRPI